LSESERACSCCGLERREIGAEESWQVEYLPGHFERIHHVRKKVRLHAVREQRGEPEYPNHEEAGDGDR
jgi:hypothetical protein